MKVLDYLLVEKTPTLQLALDAVLQRYNMLDYPLKKFEGLKLLRNRQGFVTVILLFSYERVDPDYQPYTMKRYIGQSMPATDAPVTL